MPKTEKLLARLKRNPVVSFALLGGAVVISLASFTDAVDRLQKFALQFSQDDKWDADDNPRRKINVFTLHPMGADTIEAGTICVPSFVNGELPSIGIDPLSFQVKLSAPGKSPITFYWIEPWQYDRNNNYKVTRACRSWVHEEDRIVTVTVSFLSE